MSSQISNLFTEVQLGALKLKNRFVVAPLTRQRTNPDDGVPNDLLVEYYTQRASFGLIITECSQISPLSNCFPGSAGIFSEEQVQGWKKVVDSVHSKGGLIMLQIWHCGRAVSLSQTGGKAPISSTDKPVPGKNYFANNEEYGKPERLTKEGIQQVINEFKQGAINAKRAGFDGVELHAANGYLVDQFLRDGVNDRTDEYGGSVENRSRFCLEVIDALISVFGSDRVAIRLSPTGRNNYMFDSDPMSLLQYLIPQLDSRGLAFIEVKRHGVNQWDDSSDGAKQIPTETFFEIMRKLCKGNLIANDNVSIEDMKNYLSNNICDAVSFGTLSISNPDLPERVQNGYEINYKVDRSTFFTQGAKGYTDYPLANKNI
ncbi:FAD/FMN-binding family oxidoreductase (macronuclear) [Tetrahymena thermophila SB210]|uniref:FAD/FMN-binding family oxidoreductase n=1 Tax=Tetrahymena thermophila (strain SB210) TaxID=312017 RepID=W7X817_TETTS|nr:FAD/FMN-binding family oxidoreductase [Tetrahymena thermophila SB210]EWS75520.1 FAD/FMN-binding family oxidoreductase [Tetrahymena thermophila SB210]|eukprot:XP_012651989.1 FAD/FMN-binding family oxidoreductase [Tetrahymena thermophila SB210]